MEPARALQALDSQESGLREEEAKRRLIEFGKNEIRKTRTSALKILSRQFSSILVLVLIAAAVISYLSGDSTSAAVIIAIVVINSVLGFFQDYRSHKEAEKLKK